MSYSSNLPVASQQTPWPLPPQRSGSATLDETTNDDTMTQSQATLSFSKTLPPPVAAIESDTRASPTSAVSEEKPQWQAVIRETSAWQAAETLFCRHPESVLQRSTNQESLYAIS